MPAMPFGDMVANFDVTRRERIEAKKDRIRTEMSDLETLVTGWEQEAESTKDDVPMVVAVRAMEHERSRLLDELEPLHNEVVKALTDVSSPWFQELAERVWKWTLDRRDDPERLRDHALEILDTIPGRGTADTYRLPTPSELATIRQALKLIGN